MQNFAARISNFLNLSRDGCRLKNRFEWKLSEFDFIEGFFIIRPGPK